MQLLDAKAKLVRRTKQGRIVGSKFDRLKAYSDTRMNIMPVFQQGYEGCPPFGVGTFVSPPVELFDIKESGSYVLKLEFQIFALAKKRNAIGKFIRFQPIALAVDK